MIPYIGRMLTKGEQDCVHRTRRRKAANRCKACRKGHRIGSLR